MMIRNPENPMLILKAPALRSKATGLAFSSHAGTARAATRPVRLWGFLCDFVCSCMGSVWSYMGL